MVTLQEFVSEVEKETQLLQTGATRYRQQTATLSLKVLRNVQEVTPFLKRDSAFQFVSNVLKTVDVDRQMDVAKMLHLLLTDLTTRSQLSDEFKAKLEERRRKRKAVSFVLTN